MRRIKVKTGGHSTYFLPTQEDMKDSAVEAAEDLLILLETVGCSVDKRIVNSLNTLATAVNRVNGYEPEQEEE